MTEPLATALARMVLNRDLGGLDKAAGSLRASIEKTVDAAARARQLSWLAFVLRSRFEVTEDLADADFALSAGRAAIDLLDEHDPDRYTYLNNLGNTLLARARHTKAEEDLRAAVRAFEDAGRGSADPAMLSNLANALTETYERTGEPGVLDRAVDAYHRAYAGTAEGDPDRSVFATNLSNALRMRFARSTDPEDLEAMIIWSRCAVAGGTGHPRFGAFTGNLALALRLYSEHTGNEDAIDEAVSLTRQALELEGNGPALASQLSNLGGALHERYDLSGDPADLAEAIKVHRRAVEAAPGVPGWQSNLALALRAEFERTGDAAVLDQAIQASRDAVGAAPQDMRLLANLALALRVRFERGGDPRDLEEALAHGQRTLDLASPQHFDRAGFLANQAGVLRLRFLHGGTRDDLDAAADLCEQALMLVPDGNPDRAMYLSNLGGIQQTLAEHTGAAADFDAAAETGRRAVATTSPGHPERAARLANLCNALRIHGEQHGGLSLLDEAVQAGREAVAATPEDHPALAGRLLNLGNALARRHTLTGAAADFDDAIALRRAAVGLSTAPVAVRVGAAREWADTAVTEARWDLALEGYAAGVRMLPLVAWRGLTRTGQEVRIAEWTGLASGAAACAIAAGRPEQAVELLELGRSVLWNRLLETRTDLSDLYRQYPELAGRLDEARMELDAPASDAPLRRARRLRAARAWEQAITEVRALPGYADFLRPSPFLSLRAAAADGAVVIINVSDLRCDALIVTAHGVDTVPLPEITLKDMAARADTCAAAIAVLATESATLASHRTARRVIHETLAWLYDAVAEPALSIIPGRRVWWCPTRALTQLPLQAAGHHLDGSRRTVLDRVVSSTIPSLTALTRARQPSRSAAHVNWPDGRPPGAIRPAALPPKLLITVVPQTPGMEPLAGADEEAVAVEREAGGAPITTLRGRQATCDAVQAALAGHSFAHFACHGVLDLAEPSQSGVCLYDGVLSVSEIAGLRLEDAELAVLSACHTAANAAQFADEAIHPAAAFQLAGFRQVIATSWLVSDSAAADLASRLYHELSMPGHLTANAVPEALHSAVHALRDDDPRAVMTWAAYLHSGP